MLIPLFNKAIATDLVIFISDDGIKLDTPPNVTHKKVQVDQVSGSWYPLTSPSSHFLPVQVCVTWPNGGLVQKLISLLLQTCICFLSNAEFR